MGGGDYCWFGWWELWSDVVLLLLSLILLIALSTGSSAVANVTVFQYSSVRFTSVCHAVTRFTVALYSIGFT